MSNCKSKSALAYNVDLLAKETGEMYFWTFTLPVKLHPVDAAASWRDLLRELVRRCDFYGVRVFELHPGGHGLHVHVMTNRFFHVSSVRACCRKFGWGRIHVEEFDTSDIESACGYMTKYLTKQVKMWHGEKLTGLRWWSVFGKVSDKVRVKDVTIDSIRRRIWDMVPSWVVTNIMGIDPAQDKVSGRLKSAKEKVVLSCQKMTFRAIRLFTGKDRPKNIPKLSGFTSRQFNYCKMWICNRIYLCNELLMSCFDGSGSVNFDLRRLSLGFNAVQLRSGAHFIACA